MLQMAYVTDNCRDCKHRDTGQLQVEKNEKAKSITTEAVQNFMNPFQVEMNDKLYRILFGAEVSDSTRASHHEC